MTPIGAPTATPTLTPTPTLFSGFFTLPPCRLFDTRDLDSPALDAGDTRNFVLIGNCQIPVTAKAVSLNITITQATAGGDLQLYPGDQFSTGVATIHYNAGQTRANNTILKLGAAGDLAVTCDQASGTVDLIIDVNGYFE